MTGRTGQSGTGRRWPWRPPACEWERMCWSRAGAGGSGGVLCARAPRLARISFTPARACTIRVEQVLTHAYTRLCRSSCTRWAQVEKKAPLSAREKERGGAGGAGGGGDYFGTLVGESKVKAELRDLMNSTAQHGSIGQYRSVKQLGQGSSGVVHLVQRLTDNSVCVRACMRVCVCVRVCVRACVLACMHLNTC